MINIIFSRSINQNHELSKHPDVIPDSVGNIGEQRVTTNPRLTNFVSKSVKEKDKEKEDLTSYTCKKTMSFLLNERQ